MVSEKIMIIDFLEAPHILHTFMRRYVACN